MVGNEIKTSNVALIPYVLGEIQISINRILYFRVVKPLSMRVLIQNFRSMRNWIRIQGCEDQKKQFCYSQDSQKNAQATGEAFSPQKRTSSTSKEEISSHCSISPNNFCPPGSGSGRKKLLRIHADPDPYSQGPLHCYI